MNTRIFNKGNRHDTLSVSLALLLITIFTGGGVSVGGLVSNHVVADSLPAGARISVEVSLPGDPLPTRFNYTVPSRPAVVIPTKPVIVLPPADNNPLSDGFVLGSRGTAKLIVKHFNDGRYLVEVLPGGQMLIRGPNLLERSDVQSNYRSVRGALSGGTTAWDGLTEPAGFLTPAGYVRRTFGDGAVYYERKEEGGIMPLPEPLPVDRPLPMPVVPIGPVASVDAKRNPIAFTYSSQPNRINRLQSPAVPAYRDGWKMKQSEIVLSGNGGLNETPDALRERGHNWLEARWFYGNPATPPWGLPKSTDNLHFEYTGANWRPYHESAYRSLVDDLTTIGNNCVTRLPAWNSVPDNGLIDGVPTVKEGHFNLEYQWIENSGSPESNWTMYSDQMKDTRYFNYAIGREETLRETHNRGGIPALQAALHQKWRNIIALSVLYLNANNNGMRAFYGDFWGLSQYHNLSYRNMPLSSYQMLTADVNNGSLYPYANESVNGGRITLNNGQTFDVSGNFNELQGRRNVYNYEWNVSMTRDDYNAFFSVTKDSPADQKDIKRWLPRIKPDLGRPYDMAWHIQLQRSIVARKGWSDFKFYWQRETIYEHDILVDGQSVNGAWVPWTINQPPPHRNAKLPQHPEVVRNQLFLARLHYDGNFTWGSTTRIVPDRGAEGGENLNQDVHAVSREAEQEALSELGQYNESVFTPDKRQHIGDIPIQNPQTGEYVTGNPDLLLHANGANGPPCALVTGVDSPSTGWELYYVYYPNDKHDGEMIVRWKSPVDGATLIGVAHGWGGSLYARKR